MLRAVNFEVFPLGFRFSEQSFGGGSMARIEPLGFRDLESMFLLALLAIGVFVADILVIITSLLMIVFLHPHWQTGRAEAI